MEKSLQAEGRADASKELVVAIDHGMSFPGMAGLEKPVELLRLLARCRTWTASSPRRGCTARRNGSASVWAVS